MYRLQADEEVLRNRSPEAEVEQRLQRIAVHRLHTLEQLQVFWSYKHPRFVMTRGIADSRSKDRKLNVLARRFAFGAQQVIHAELVVQRHYTRTLRLVRQNGRREVLVAHSRKVERPIQGRSARDLFRRDVLILAALHEVNRRIGGT